MRFSKHCPKCDGDNVFYEAFATWNIERQEWIFNEGDMARCGDCFWSGYTVKTKPIDEAKENIFLDVNDTGGKW